MYSNITGKSPKRLERRSRFSDLASRSVFRIFAHDSHDCVHSTLLFKILSYQHCIARRLNFILRSVAC
jgi:hypothetical protein